MRLLINIDVPELEPAITFYSAALDLKLNRILDEDVAELYGASSTIYLQRNPAGSPPVDSRPLARSYERHWTPVHIDFVVDDLMQAAQRALDAGAARESECVQWNGSRCITFSDPFGNGFCLIEFDDESYGPGGPVEVKPAGIPRSR